MNASSRGEAAERVRIGELELLQRWPTKARRQYTAKTLLWQYCPRCRWCGCVLERFSDVTLEHVNPMVMGGADNESNYDIACAPCNNGRIGVYGEPRLTHQPFAGLALAEPALALGPPSHKASTEGCA